MAQRNDDTRPSFSLLSHNRLPWGFDPNIWRFCWWYVPWFISFSTIFVTMISTNFKHSKINKIELRKLLYQLSDSSVNKGNASDTSDEKWCNNDAAESLYCNEKGDATLRETGSDIADVAAVTHPRGRGAHPGGVTNTYHKCTYQYTDTYQQTNT